MFTFGIFTTHIPYIALMAFYAYFLLFGMEKASKGEIPIENNTFIFKVQIAESPDAGNPVCYYYHTSDLFAEHAKFEDFVFKRKISLPAFADNLYYRFQFSPTTFNRPPPFIG